MKRFLFFIFSLSIILSVACGKIQSKPVINNIDYVIASKLQDLDKNYSDETLKALSITIRNNILIDDIKDIKSDVNDKYVKIANSTQNLVLKSKLDNLVKISLENNKDYVWQKNIKKSDILEFALKHNISLANISDIEEISDNDKIIGIKIGNKYFDYETLSDYFKLESNQVTSISSNKNEIIINGKGKGFESYFDIEKSEQLSINNHNFSDILNYFFSDLKLVKNKC